MERRIRNTAILLSIVALLVAGLGAAMAVRLQGTGRVTAEAVPSYWDAPAFTLADHAGGTLSTGELAGTVWLASFVYTRCPDFCPLVTRRMAELRDGLEADGLLGTRVRLVSITVDPAHDTPEVLRAYADGFGANAPAEWAFLTGEPDAVRALVEDGFKLPASHVAGGDAHAHPAGDDGANDDGAYTVMHSDRILLIDRAGRVRGFYAATDSAEQARLEDDLRAVLEG